MVQHRTLRLFSHGGSLPGFDELSGELARQQVITQIVATHRARLPPSARA